jgi:glycosyltransferase involved in cell wall biosynthesis
MITVILPVKNVEGIIDDCLNGVRWADEVLLVDGNSSDKTLDIAATYPNVRVVHHPSKDIRVIVSESEPLAQNPWIFWLCADELVTPELGKEIQERCASAPAEVGGFLVPARDILYGVEWDRTWTWPRIWRKGTARFEFKRMHEMPVIKGSMEKLTNFYWHIDNPNIRTLIPKLLRYEYVDAQNASDEACARVNSGFGYQLLRFNYLAIREFFRYRRYGFPAVENAFGTAFGHLLRHLLLVEELRIRKGLTRRDTNGWG